MRSPAVLFGVPIDHLTMNETIERIGELIADGRRRGRVHQVATVNVDFLVNALMQPDLKVLLQSASLNMADGMPLVWGGSLLGTPLPERVAGSDLVPLLAERSADQGWKVYYFGGSAEVAEQALAWLGDHCPGADFVVDAGPIIRDVTDVDAESLQRIVDFDPDILCVALGNPKQERFIAAQADHLRCPVMIGIGGSLDMLVGDKKRAPGWAQRAGVEWVFRAAQEPGRLGRRYFHDARVFGPQILRYLRMARRYRHGSVLHIDVRDHRVRVYADDTLKSSGDWAAIEDARSMSSIHLDCDTLRGITVESHAALCGLLRCAQRRDIPLTSEKWTSELRTCFDDFGTLQWIHSLIEDSASR